MAKKDVAISASMTDKELLASIEQTLRRAEDRFDVFATRVSNSLSQIESSSGEVGKTLGKSISDGFINSTKPFEARIAQLEAQLKKIGEAKIKPSVPTIGTSDAMPTIDVGNLNTAVLTAARLQAIFKNIRSNTTAIRNNIDKLGQAKRSTEEQRINTIIAKRELMVQRELTYKERAISQATRLVAIERQNRINSAGQSYDSAMAMANNTIQERIDKIKALQIVQRNLSESDEKQARQLKDVNREMERLKRLNIEASTSGVELKKTTNGLAESFKNLSKRVLFYAGLGALTGFLKQLYSVRGEYESLERSIGAVLGDFEKGSQIFREQQQLALKSPFTVLDLAGATKQLAAYNFQAEELVDVSRRLADISAALGVPMERLTYNLGQIRAQTVLTARDARDFANAGLPITTELSKMYTELEGRVVSVGEVMDRMSSKMVSFSDVMAVLNRYTDEGGMFFDFQAKQAETLRGQLSNLTDAYNNMLNEMGKDNQGVLSGSVSILRTLLEHWRGIFSIIKVLTITYGTYRAAQMLMTVAITTGAAATKALTIAQIAQIRTTEGVAAATLKAAAAHGVLRRAMLWTAANPYGAALVGAISLVAIIGQLIPKTKSLQERMDDLSDSSNSLQDAFAKRDRIDQLIKSYDSLGQTIYTTQNRIDELKEANDQSEESNKQLADEVTKNKKAHEALKKVMNDIAHEAGPGVISEMSKLGEVLGINAGKARSLANSLVEIRKDKVEGEISDLSKERDRVQADLERMVDLYKRGKVLDKSTNGRYEKKGTEGELRELATDIDKTGKLLEGLTERMRGSIDTLTEYKKKTGEIVVDISKWKKDVQAITDKNGSFAVDFKTKDGEDIYAYIDRLKKSYRELHQQEEDLGKGLGASPEERERTEKQLVVVREIAKTIGLDLRTQKEINKEKKTEIDRLKEQLNLLDKISKGYEDVIKKTGNVSQAADYVKKAYQDLFDEVFKGTGLDMGRFLTLSSKDKIAFLDDISKTLNGPEAKKVLEKKKAEIALEYNISINEASISSAKKKIESLFQGYELELEIEDAGQFGSIFKSLFEYDPVTLDELNSQVGEVISQIEDKVKSYTDRKGELIQLVNIAKTQEEKDAYIDELNALEKAESEAYKSIESIRRKLSDTNAKYYSDNFKALQELQSKYADVETKITEIERKRLSKQANLMDESDRATTEKAKLEVQLDATSDPETREELKAQIANLQKYIDQDLPTLSVAIDTESNQAKADVSFAAFKKTPYWAAAFTDMETVATSSLKVIEQKMEEFKSKVGQDLSPTELKTYEDALVKIRTTMESRNPFKALADSFKEVKSANQELTAAQKKLDAALASGDPEAIKEAEEGVFVAKNNVITAEEKQIKAAKKVVDITFSMVDSFQSLTGVLGDTGEVAMQSMQMVAMAAIGVAQAIKTTERSSIILAIISAALAVAQAVVNLFNSKNKKIDKAIEKSERTVKSLENAYKNLERAVEQSLGTSEIMARKAAIANQKLQLVELKRQLALEKSRSGKDRDEDRIIEIEGQIIDLQNSISDATQAIVDELLGSNIKSAAESFAESWIDAWKSGEDTIQSIEQGFSDMIDNMIVKALASQIVANRLKAMYAMIERFTQENSDGGVGVTEQEAKEFAKLAETLTPLINEDFKRLMNGLGIAFGSGVKDAALSGLQKGIQGVTEQTAGAIEGYMNAMSGQVFEQTFLLQDIVNFCNIGTATSSQVLLTLRDSYQVMLALQTWAENITIPSGNGINVRILS